MLHLTAELPYAPGGTGGSTRQFELLRRLVERGHEVVVAAPVPERLELDTGAPEIMRRAGLDYRPLRRPPSRERELAAALRRHPGLLASLFTKPVVSWQFEAIWVGARGAARRLAEELRPDAITIEHDHLVSWSTAVDGLAPLVLSSQNATWRLYESRARSARGVRRPALAAEALRYRRNVAAQLARFDLVVAVSRGDAEAFEELGAQRVEVVPNGANFEGTEARPPAAGPPTLLFTGSLDHPPNREAALWLGHKIWPLVAGKLPDARLVIAGRGPNEQLRRLLDDPRIEVTGPVPDMRPYFEAATAVAAPLRSGGGTRLKILEALAAGRPVVSTSVGAEGLELEPGRDLLVADGPAPFAAAAVRLLTDADLRDRLAQAGRSRAEARYDWRAVGERFTAVLEAVALGS